MIQAHFPDECRNVVWDSVTWSYPTQIVHTETYKDTRLKIGDDCSAMWDNKNDEHCRINSFICVHSSAKSNFSLSDHNGMTLVILIKRLASLL